MSERSLRGIFVCATVAVLLCVALSAAALAESAGTGAAINMQTSVGGLAVPNGLNTIVITVVVTKASTGRPVSTLGGSVGTGSGVIELPQGWTFTQMTSAGDIFLPVKFENRGKGIYDIHVRVFVTTWQKGFHSYVVRFWSPGYSGATTGYFTIIDY